MLSWCGNETLTKLLPLGPLPKSPATEIGQRQRPNSQASILWLIVGLFLSRHSFFSCYHTGTPSHVDFDFWPACKKETRVEAVRKSYAFPRKQLNYRQTFAFLETTFSGVAPQLLWSKPLHLHTRT